MRKIVFIGDSLTEWYDWQKRFPEHRVLNLGISGETVEELQARKNNIRSRIESPDIIFLMTGINNILMERYDIAGPYRDIVGSLTEWYKEAAIVVQSLLPVDSRWTEPGVIRDINRRLAEIAREQGAKYLDVYSRFAGPDGKPKSGLLQDDGVHVSAKGYEVWADAVKQAQTLVDNIQKQLPQ